MTSHPLSTHVFIWGEILSGPNYADRERIAVPQGLLPERKTRMTQRADQVSRGPTHRSRHGTRGIEGDLQSQALRKALG